MIIVNGLPKSGTHAVMAWLSRMGLKRCPGVVAPGGDRLVVHGQRLDLRTLSATPDSVFMQGHVPATYDLTGFSVVTVFRDPRNVLVSYVRHSEHWRHLSLTLPEAMANFWGERFVPTYSSYLDWIGRAIVLRYENLEPSAIGDGSGIYAPDRPHWDKWIGNTRTGKPSDWQDYWDDETDRAWRAEGGPELVERAGYGSHPLPDDGVAALIDQMKEKAA